MSIVVNKHGKMWKNASDEEKISYCESLFTDSKEHMRRRHFEWYMNYMFLEGHHYTYFNTVTNVLERPPRKKGEVRLVINKIKSSIRAIKNYVTRENPKWVVTPGDLDEDTIMNARRAGKFMDWLYRSLHLETMVTGVVDASLNTSLGPVELDWDDKAANGLGQIVIKLHDPFDIFSDPRGYFYAGKFVGRFISKAIKKPTDEVKSDDRYDKKKRKDVKADDELAASEMKARILRKESGLSDTETIKRTTIKEFQLYEDEPNEKKGNIRLVTYAGGQLLRDEPLEKKEFSLYFMQSPLNPLKVYQRAWTTDAVPLNKALDRAVSQKIMYVNQALVFRIIAEKGHGVNRITTDQGEILEINKNRKWEQATMLPLPMTVDRLTSELNIYIEDLLGAHDAALGRMPKGARSGRTLEAIQAADSNNLAGIVQSLNSFLTVLGKEILNIVAEKYVTSRIAKITEPEEGGQEFLRVIGEGAPEKAKRKEATIITKDNELQVGIGSWLGFTREAQRETLINLAELGVIPGEEIIRQFEFPNVEELSQKAREQRLEEHELQAEIAGRKGEGGAGGKTAGGVNTKALADKENTAMMNGEPLPPTEGADMEHTQAHMDFMQTDIFVQASPEIQANIENHARGELQTQGIGGA